VDVNVLLAGLIVSSLGAGMFLYGKNTQRLVPLVVGLLLIVVPFIVYNVIALGAICAGSVVLAWVLREK
jgi:hypothetical protein